MRSEYDAWYDTEAGKAIFAMEVDCLRPLLYGYSRPSLEVGVGLSLMTIGDVYLNQSKSEQALSFLSNARNVLLEDTAPNSILLFKINELLIQTK